MTKTYKGNKQIKNAKEIIKYNYNCAGWKDPIKSQRVSSCQICCF